MEAKILDGKALAAIIKAEVETEVTQFKAKHGFVPGIAVIQVGGDPASERYVKQIARSFEGVGMGVRLCTLAEMVSEAESLGVIRQLNAEAEVSGIIIQLPLPKHLYQETLVAALSPLKDVDGVHPLNAGLLLMGSGDYFIPATPAGGMELLRRNGIEITGRHAVVVGRSNIVGKPMALLLLHQHATVTICHSRTPNLGEVTRTADILVAAVGKEQLIKQDMVKPGAVVIDFGVNVIEGKLVGDVDFDSVKEVAGAITPVPGGTGPMTNAALLRNTLQAARRQAGMEK
ncbi:MAG: bifunctional 5,10-methylenetetrahydrofolate dehydrogenase/5,10-methenyltetrahydrofolate cyclohydrolase [Chloroflexi bacterium]|nr:bifunctional 5,10-methylenetetrahydrofolate dehydrogenase/5,10-methenyltetrahydrofolate cyclohydrolase [Chloroflexota bacterium]MCL5075251.1 bifunctional 5,10-methylenetetrahydrofolate dehydrogenase/5,10-methenyltetrahydrofolate cyclohydrolase [Chloroflexota bacterium]